MYYRIDVLEDYKLHSPTKLWLDIIPCPGLNNIWDNHITNLINTYKLCYFHFIWPQYVKGTYQVAVNWTGIYVWDYMIRLPESDVRSRMCPWGLYVWVSIHAWHWPWPYITPVSSPASLSTAQKGQAWKASRSCPPRPGLPLCPLHYPCGFSRYEIVVLTSPS